MENPALSLSMVQNKQCQCSVFQYLDEGDSCSPRAAGGVSSPGQQVGKCHLQAVAYLSPSKAQTWDELAQH